MVEQWSTNGGTVLVESGLNQCGSGADRIHWFRVDARPIRVKKVCGLKNIRICVEVA